ncbi:Pre-rRNA-processing protein esf2 [Orchesella cincta]|uniref:Activator of basal transcription 1 n=1 Tax=Orchesella cincta TaxID=48709 RepID=A0A1D2M3T0_ORCCI|nr:Pre-rRNA-processing protein esf2 [Orchesella cincta]
MKIKPGAVDERFLIAEDEIKEEIESDQDMDEEVDDDDDMDDDRKRPCERGRKGCQDERIIYLSKIPPKMNVKRVRDYFTQFGELNRSFLQPEKTLEGKAQTKNQTFTEGWIEFKKRRHAKRVAEMLNNQPVGGKKSKEYHDFLWNIKYLRDFCGFILTKVGVRKNITKA